MPVPDHFLLFVRPLNQAGLRYVVTGSVAAIFYGEPRLTHDVDFVVFLNNEEILQLPRIFPAAQFYLPPPEAMLAEISRPQRGHFNLIHLDTGFKADLYPTGRDELNAWAFRFKRPIKYEEETIMIAPPEYVIVRKLEYFREGRSEKHLRDIRSMLAISGEQIDRTILSKWIQNRGLEQEWKLTTS
jgi:hypothetical protein